MLDAIADRLDQQPQRLACHLNKAFYPQHVMRSDGGANARDQRIGRDLRRNVEYEALEIVVIVLGLDVVM